MRRTLSLRRKGAKAMKNRKLLLIVSLLAALTISLGGTIAYLTDTDSDVNVMTLGNVDIVQLENGQEENGFAQGAPLYPAYYEEEIDWANTPGVLDKEVAVENVGPSEAYVRTWFAFEAGDLSFDEFRQYILLNMNEGNESPWEWAWDTSTAYSITDSDGNTAQYYIAVATLKEALQPGDTTAASLYDVAMSKDATNAQVEPMGNEYNVLTFTQAMQTVNFENVAPADALNIGFDTAAADGVDFAKHPWVDGVENPDAFTVPGTTIRLVKADKPQEGGTVYLNSADDLRYLQTLIEDWKTITGSEGHDHYYYQSGWTVELNCDVDLNNEPWTPVVISEFGGFDGNNHTISNLKIETTEKQAGLFSNTLNNDSGICPISNLVIDGADVTGGEVVGVVVGYATTPITNVTVKNATVNCSKYAGGIVGKAGADLINCTVTDATINCTGKEVGGIVGFLATETSYADDRVIHVSNCSVNNTQISGTEEVAGIVGRAYAIKGSIEISDCTVADDVTITATKEGENYCGKILGRDYDDDADVIIK
ncbi:MAG: hypothetical protein E7320_12180 [Clostridiales bacterium]|nr:hypothetical protein [Clostridiales bacterium]